MPLPFTLEQYKRVSTLGLGDTYPLSVWVGTANMVLSTFNFDTSTPYFDDAIQVIGTAIVDYFYTQHRREVVMSANNPFKTVKLGSFSKSSGSQNTTTTNITEQIINSLPPLVIYLINLMLKEPDARIVTSRVFEEAMEIGGERPFEDVIQTEYPLYYGNDRRLT